MPEDQQEEKRRLRDGLIFASIFVLLMWIMKLAEIVFEIDLFKYGIYPRRFNSLPGILLTPLLHENLTHLFNNTVPLFLSVTGIFYFFRKYAVDILVFSYIMTGLLIWLFARDAYHIGASGIVYTYISFLFFGGVLSNNKNLMAVSLIIVFIYGSLFWGILPVKTNVSWESHLLGAINGLAFAFIYRKTAIPDKKELREEDDDDDEDAGLPPEEQPYWHYSNHTGQAEAEKK